MAANNHDNLPIWVVDSWWKPRSACNPRDLAQIDFLDDIRGTPAGGIWKFWLNWRRGVDFDKGSCGYWLLIDEAQTSYFDTGFWNDFIKNIDCSPNYVILFSSYGSPGTNTLEIPLSTYYQPLARTYIAQGRRISLHSARSLPTVVGQAGVPSLQDPAIAHLFRFLLCHKRICESTDVGLSKDLVDHTALLTCFSMGWVHADLVYPDSRFYDNVYVLPPRFHEWYISCVWNLSLSLHCHWLPRTSLGRMIYKVSFRHHLLSSSPSQMVQAISTATPHPL